MSTSKLRFFFQESWLLMVSAVIFGALLAATDAAWTPRIRQNEASKFGNRASSLLAGAVKFEPAAEKIAITLKGKPYEVDIRKGLDAAGNCVGWAFLCEASGFADKIKLVVAADVKFETLKGFAILACNETPGFGDKITIKNGFYQAQFQGAPAGKLTLVKIGDAKKIDNEIVAITGATVTSRAVVDALNAYIVPIKQQLKEKGLLQ